MDCAEKNWDLDVKAHRTEKKQKTMTTEEKFVMANEKADKFAKDGAEVNGRAKAAAKASSIEQLRKCIYASTEKAHFHVHIEE